MVVDIKLIILIDIILEKLLFLSSLSVLFVLRTTVQAHTIPETHKLCLNAKDYSGCMKTNSKTLKKVNLSPSNSEKKFNCDSKVWRVKPICTGEWSRFQ